MRALTLAVAPLALVALIFFAVLRTGEPAPLWRAHIPREALRRDRCTWYCHNHGCPHRPVLPAVLTGDAYLFGATIRALRTSGDVLVPGGRGGVGYGAANLMLFCMAWPGAMYALYLIAVHQRLRLRAMRRRARECRGAER